MPKIGDALKNVVEMKPREKASESRARASSPLMNENRRRIFQYLCTNPCSAQGRISRALDISRPTVSWHLDQLIKSGYLTTYLDGNRRLFSPPGLLSEKSMTIFSILNEPAGMGIYRAILYEPGLDPATLKGIIESSPGRISRLLERMLAADLLISVRDGRHIRYFPGQGHVKAAKEDAMSRKEFLRRLMARMDREHLRPEMNELKGSAAIISISLSGHIQRIQIPLHPLENLLQNG